MPAVPTIFAAARTFLKSIPAAVWMALGFALFLCWFAGHQYERGYAKRTAEYEAATVRAVERARKADEAARETATATTTAIEEGNDRAREAARNSDDPLRDGFDSLRP